MATPVWKLPTVTNSDPMQGPQQISALGNATDAALQGVAGYAARNTNLTIPADNYLLGVSFDGTIEHYGGMADAPYGFTVPYLGWYLVTAQGRWGYSPTSAGVSVTVKRNSNSAGTTGVGVVTWEDAANPAAGLGFQISQPVKGAVNDTLQLFVSSAKGGMVVVYPVVFGVTLLTRIS